MHWVDTGLGGALLAVVLLGAGCGVLGSFLLVRRESLFGDMLAHAVLPGVVLGFLVSKDHHPWMVLGLALVTGLLGTELVEGLRRTTKLKYDACLGVGLGLFFAIGIVLWSVNKQSGVNRFLYGQASAIDRGDLVVMGWVIGIVLLGVGIGWRLLVGVSFDREFSQSIRFPVKWAERLFSVGVTLVIVVAMQAVGVVLVTALLITPAATAFLWTDRFGRMVIFAVIFAIGTGVAGCGISYAIGGMATGPLIALLAGVGFGICFLVAPRYGVVGQWWRQLQQRRQVEREHLLKGLYGYLEAGGFRNREVAVREFSQWLGEGVDVLLKRIKVLVKRGAVVELESGVVELTEAGFGRARELVRGHRLWELYLTEEARYAPDHVHDDADRVEHLLDEKTRRELEKRLNFPEKDPHGSRIPPSVLDLEKAGYSISERKEQGDNE